MVIRLSEVERASLDRIAEAWDPPADALRWGLRAVLNDNPDFREVAGRGANRD